MKSFFVDADIAKAKTLDTDFYNNQDCYEAAKEAIFAPTWQYVGDVSMVGGEANAHPFVLLPGYVDEPLVLLKDSENTLRCMSNVCTHRGNLVVTEACKVRHLRCKYHGRQFSADGKFLSMPEFKEVCDFPTAADDLAVLPVLQWGKLVFTSLTAAYTPQQLMGEMMERVAWYPMDALVYRPDLNKDYDVSAHWALYCENYLEGFHIPFVHEGLNQVLDFGDYSTELYEYSNLQLGIGKEGEVCFDLPESSVDYGKQVAAYYFWVFPNMMFNFYPWGLSLNVVKPTGINSCRVSFVTYVLDESKRDVGAGSGLDTVELEDEAIVQQVQQGVRSRFYKHGRYSVTREQGTHHFHRLLAYFMNRNSGNVT